VRRLRGGRFAVNCGVTGKPDHDGDPAVHYALIALAAGEEPRLEIRRVSYDHERWARAMEAAGVAPIFVAPIRTGVWTTGVASLPPAERGRWARAEAVSEAATRLSARPERLERAAFERVLGALGDLGLVTAAEADEVLALIGSASPFFAATRLADSVHVHVKVAATDALPRAAIERLGGRAENERPGYVKLAFAGGINVIFSSIPVAEEDELPPPPAPRTKPFVDHVGVDLRRTSGEVRAVFDELSSVARRAGWCDVGQSGPGAPVFCCHVSVAEKRWAFPPREGARWRLPVEFAFGPIAIHAATTGCDLRPLDPRDPRALSAARSASPPPRT